VNDTVTRQTRWLIRRDMDAVLSIENNSFAEPWSEEDFLTCLKQRNVIGCVSEMQFGDVDGFMIYGLHKHHLEVLKIAVDAKSRRCGIARHMVDRLKVKLDQQKRTRIHIEVHESNLAAQLFLRDCGFRATKVKGDSYLFQWILGVASDPKNPIRYPRKTLPQVRPHHQPEVGSGDGAKAGCTTGTDAWNDSSICFSANSERGSARSRIGIQRDGGILSQANQRANQLRAD